MPLQVNSALGNLKYVVNTRSVFCASCIVLSSAFSTPVDDVAAKGNPEFSGSWPSAGHSLCYCWILSCSLD